MKKTLSKKVGFLSLVFIAAASFALYSPMLCHGVEYDLSFDFSPNIINISSERLGAIRILTVMSYSFYVANGDSIFLYFNGCEESVPYIMATRDSVGRLILRFSIDDLLYLEDCLLPDDFNDVKVVIIMKNGDEYIGEGEVYINDKKAP